MKKILLFFHHFRTPKDLGGLRSWHIGSRLAKEGYQVTAVVPGVDTLTGKRKTGLSGRLWSTETIDGVEVIWTNCAKNDRNSKLRRALYYLSSTLSQAVVSLSVRDVDLVFCTSIPLTSMWLALVHAKIRRVPLVIDVRDLVLDTALELGYLSSTPLVRAALELESIVLRSADRLIPVSLGWKKGLIKKGVPTDKMDVVPLGFDGLELYEGHTDWGRDIKEEHGLTGKFVVAYVGTLGHVFDIPTVLRAAELTIRNKGIHYLFAGGGQRLEEFREIANDKGLHCTFVGQLPKSEIPLICSQSNICVCPYRDGEYVAAILGNKIFDYLGNGTATIFAGPKGDVSRMIEDSGGGICVPAGDAVSMAAAIEMLYENPNKVKLMSNRAKKFVEQNYRVESMMDKLVLILSNILAVKKKKTFVSTKPL